MPTYTAPGVYFERADARDLTIGIARTDIAGLVGIAARGPLYTPIRVRSQEQFQATFGGTIPNGYLPCAVQGFFENGGDTCWAVRVADETTAASAFLDLAPALRLTASSPGAWGNRLRARVVPTSPDRFTLILRLGDEIQELWPGMTLATAASLLNGRSALAVAGPSPAGAALQADGFAGGRDGLASLKPEHLLRGLATLETIEEIGIIALPDSVAAPPRTPEPRIRPVPCDRFAPPDFPQPPPPDDQPEFPPATGDRLTVLHQALIDQCLALKNRFAILDPAPDEVATQQVLARRDRYDSAWAALYWPWLQIPDPLRLAGLLRPVPPSGHVAGVYARVDLGGDSRFAAQIDAGLAGRNGVHRSPANQVVEGTRGVSAVVDDTLHGLLNERQVNVIRSQPGRGIRIVGARTLGSDPRWRYVAVRRLMTMIMVSIDRETQWIPFEPDSPETWRDTERVVGAFLLRLWRRGMLDGASAEEAFSVRCDAATNPESETGNGRMICEIGVLPPWPAEFVVVRIGRTENGTELL